MDLSEQHATAKDPALLNRVEQAAIATALAVMAEDPATSGHDRRAAFAGTVLHDSRAQARKLAHGLVTLPGASTDATDGAVLSATAAIWDAYAGHNPNA